MLIVWLINRLVNCFVSLIINKVYSLSLQAAARIIFFNDYRHILHLWETKLGKIHIHPYIRTHEILHC